MGESGLKRRPEESALVAAKKQRTEGSIVAREGTNAIIPVGLRRTSNLQAPIMQLSPHSVRRYRFVLALSFSQFLGRGILC